MDPIINNENFSDKKVIVIGTIFLDIKGFPTGRFVPKDRNAGRIEYKYGGVARNVAEDLLSLGMHPVFISLADESGMGKAIVRDLEDKGVNTDYVITSENGVGTWLAIFDNDGDICANISKRQDLSPLLNLLEQSGDDIFKGADGIMMEMDIEEMVISKVFDIAKINNVPVYGVISNMEIARKRISQIRKTQCFMCNKMEAELLFGSKPENNEIDTLINWLSENLKAAQIPCMVVTLGPAGAVYADISPVTPTNPIHTESHPATPAINAASGIIPAKKVPVADTTGAGDSFFAGTCAGLIAGLDIRSACVIGTEMAAQVIQTTDNVIK